MLKKGRDQDVADKGWWGVSGALGPLQTFRDHRTHCADLPATGLPGWLLLPFIKLHLPFIGPRSGHGQRCLCPFYPVFRPGAQLQSLPLRLPCPPGRGAGNNALPSPQQPSTSDCRPHINASLTSEADLHSVPLWASDFGETQNYFVGKTSPHMVRFFFCDISQYPLLHVTSK